LGFSNEQLTVLPFCALTGGKEVSKNVDESNNNSISKLDMTIIFIYGEAIYKYYTNKFFKKFKE